MGSEKSGIPLFRWIGVPEWEQVPECVKAWIFARMNAESHAAKWLRQKATPNDDDDED